MLEESFPELATSQPELLAHHFAEAGLDDAAVNYWHKGGERALERSANAEAAAHLERAIRHLVTLPESTERNRRELPLQMALGSTMRALKGHAADETLKVYNRARALLDETIPAKQRMAVLYGAWSVTVVRGDCVPALEIARQSLALAQSDDDPEAAAFASRMIGIALWLTGSFEEAVPHLERAVRLYAPGSGNVTDLRYSQDHAVWALSVLALVLLVARPSRSSCRSSSALVGVGTSDQPWDDNRIFPQLWLGALGLLPGGVRGRAAPMLMRRSTSASSTTSDPISHGDNSIAASRRCAMENTTMGSN